MKAALLALTAFLLLPGCREDLGGYGQECFGNGTCKEDFACLPEGEKSLCYPVGADGERCRRWTRLCDPGLVCGADDRCCADGVHSGEFVFGEYIHQRVGVTSNLAVFDFNSDGVPDLALLGKDFTSGEPGVNIVFLGVSDGGFTVDADSFYPLGADPSRLAVGDFNGDQAADLAVVGDMVDVLYVLLGNEGDGTFADPVEYQTSPSPGDVAVIDIDNDGIQDIAVVTRQHPANVFLGNGDGTFPTSIEGPDNPDGYHQGISPQTSIAAGQLDGDSTGELAIIGGGGQAYAAVLDWDDTGPALVAGDQVAIGTEGWRHHMTGGDFNNDGTLDLAAVENETDKLNIVLGAGDGTLAAPAELEVCDMPESISAADLNGDQITDLFMPCGGMNEIAVLLGNGDGTFAPQKLYRMPPSNDASPKHVRAGDFNRDGLVDIMIQNFQGPLLMMLGVGRCGG